jgi:integrase
MLKFVNSMRVKKRKYYYYRRFNQRVKLPNDPNSLEFIAAYHRIHESFESKGTIKPYLVGSVASLIEAFKGSTEYKALKDQVKKHYSRNFDEMIARIGDLQASAMTRAVFLKWRDNLKDTPSKANNFIATVSRLYSWGIDRELLTVNPARDIKKLKIGEWRSWKDHEIDAFLKVASPETALALCLALYTGQRLSDVINMKWNQISDNGIEVVQKKTGAKVWIPIHRTLQTMINKHATKKSIYILTSVKGLPFTPDNLKHTFKDTSRLAGLPEDCVFHGLRKTAAVRLAEAGCSTEQIKSITGHSTTQMVEHYTKDANQKTLAKSAMKLLEFKP